LKEERSRHWGGLSVWERVELVFCSLSEGAVLNIASKSMGREKGGVTGGEKGEWFPPDRIFSGVQGDRGPSTNGQESSPESTFRREKERLQKKVTTENQKRGWSKEPLA